MGPEEHGDPNVEIATAEFAHAFADIHAQLGIPMPDALT